MAERIKDTEDLQLEALFRSDPIEDDGFSKRIVSKVRHRMWVRRLSMPIAIAIGALISIKPLMQALAALPGLLTSIFGNSISLDSLPLGELPQLSTMLFGLALAMAMVLASRLLEE
jgi:hypothetical protein